MRRDDRDDEHLKDKQSVRVPLMMMDAAAQHRPGFRTGSDSYRDVKSERNAAYAAYDEAVTSAYRNPLGGGGSDNPATGFGSSGPRGSAVGDPCTLNGWPGRLVAGEGGKLVCRITSRHDADFKKKQKRNARNQEEGTEEYEEDSVSIKDAFRSLAQRFGLTDADGEADWGDLIRICRQLNEFNGNGDDDEVDRIVRAYSTHHESTVRRDVPDAKKLAVSHSDKMSGVYGIYDQELRDAWRNHD